MPKVQYTRQGAGKVRSPRINDTVEVTGEQAKAMVDAGDAVIVREEKTETPESETKSTETTSEKSSGDSTEESSSSSSEKTSSKSSKSSK